MLGESGEDTRDGPRKVSVLPLPILKPTTSTEDFDDSVDPRERLLELSLVEFSDNNMDHHSETILGQRRHRGRKNGQIWTKEATTQLIKFRKKFHYMFDDPTQKKVELWKVVSRKMLELGFHYDYRQISKRWNNLAFRYRSAVDHNARFPNSQEKRTPFFDEVASVYNYTPSHGPVVRHKPSQEESGLPLPGLQDDTASNSSASSALFNSMDGPPCEEDAGGDPLLGLLRALRRDRWQQERERLRLARKMHKERMAMFHKFLNVLKNSRHTGAAAAPSGLSGCEEDSEPEWRDVRDVSSGDDPFPDDDDMWEDNSCQDNEEEEEEEPEERVPEPAIMPSGELMSGKHKEDELLKPVENRVCEDRSDDGCATKQHVGSVRGEGFEFPGSLLRHRREVHRNQESKTTCTCDVCGEMFDQHSELLSHKKRHVVEGPYLCDVCNTTLKTLGELTEHMSAHIEPTDLHQARPKQTELENVRVAPRGTPSSLYKPFVCVECTQGFLYASNLRRHTREIHQNLKPLQCDQCGKRYGRKDDLKKHKRTHKRAGEVRRKRYKEEIWDPKKQFVCEECGQGFTFANGLKRHVQIIHRNIKPLQCDECGKSYGRTDDFKNHKLSHMVQRAREERQKKWKEESLYHKRRHIQEYPYICNVCDKTFQKMDELRKHMSTHAEFTDLHKCLPDLTAPSTRRAAPAWNPNKPDKPFSCEECGQGFTFANALRRHVQIIHRNIKPFKCDMCGKRYGRMDDFKNHKLTHMAHHAEEQRQEGFSYFDFATGTFKKIDTWQKEVQPEEH